MAVHSDLDVAVHLGHLDVTRKILLKCPHVGASLMPNVTRAHAHGCASTGTGRLWENLAAL